MFSSIIAVFALKWKYCSIKYNHVGHGSYAEEKKYNFEIKILGKATGKKKPAVSGEAILEMIHIEAILFHSKRCSQSQWPSQEAKLMTFEL